MARYGHPDLISYREAADASHARKKAAREALLTDSTPTYKEMVSADPDLVSLDKTFPVSQVNSAASMEPKVSSGVGSVWNAISSVLPSADSVMQYFPNAIEAAGTGLSNYMSVQEAKRASDYGQASVDDMMKWQERLSNTAHQREQLDMRRAGLNPALAATMRGASVPAGGFVGGQQGSTDNLVAGLANSAQANKRLNIDAKRAAADIDLTKSKTKMADLANEAAETWLGKAVRYGAKGADVIGSLAKVAAAFL